MIMVTVIPVIIVIVVVKVVTIVVVIVVVMIVVIVVVMIVVVGVVIVIGHKGALLRPTSLWRTACGDACSASLGPCSMAMPATAQRC